MIENGQKDLSTHSVTFTTALIYRRALAIEFLGIIIVCCDLVTSLVCRLDVFESLLHLYLLSSANDCWRRLQFKCSRFSAIWPHKSVVAVKWPYVNGFIWMRADLMLLSKVGCSGIRVRSEITITTSIRGMIFIWFSDKYPICRAKVSAY